MLKLPSFQYYDDLRVTVYQHDSRFWAFSFLPDHVALRRDQNGKEVFQLIKYAYSDEDRENDPTLSKGGGLLNFDIELRLPENDMTELRSRLQSYVDGEWNRLKSLADQQNVPVEGLSLPTWHNRTNGVPRPAGDTGAMPALKVDDVLLGLDPDRPNAPPGDRPPAVELSFPEWTKGTFSLTVPSADNLVTNSITEAPLSLTGPNTAACMVELTPAGATLIEKTLTNPDGSGGADLLPISFRMETCFLGRTPPVKLDISADSRALYQAMESIDHDFDRNGCRTDDIAHYETNLEMAVESKLIEVTYDTGMLSADDDLVKEIRNTAMGIVEDLMKEKFLEQAPPPDGDTGDDLIGAKTDYYILKQEASVDFSTIQYRETMNSIIEIEKNPQATLQGFFAGKTAAEMSEFVRSVDLTDPFFQSLGLTVNCYADFENTPIAFVEVQLRYIGTDENGQRVVKTESLSFDGTENGKEWDPSLIGNERRYFSRWRVGYEGREAEEWSDWERQIQPVLNIAVPNSGKVDVQVLAGRVDFAQIVDQVQVDVSYEDSSSDVDLIAETFRLTGAEQSHSFTHDIFTEKDKPLKWSAKFFLKDGQVIETEEETEDSSTLLINAPLFDTLDVNLVPTGKGWANVEQSIIDLVYEDEANDYIVDATMRIVNGLSEFKEWNVVVQDRDFRKFKYKVTTSFKDGRSETTEFVELDGDQSVPINVSELPTLDVAILPALVDFNATPVVTCTMRYEDQDNDINEVHTFAFDESNRSMTEWSIEIEEDSPRTYTRELTYHTFHGVIERDPEISDETAFTVPRVAVPEVKCTFNGRQVDFIDTPLIELQITYTDPVNGTDTTDSLTLESAADRPVFQHNVAESSPRSFLLEVIYHMSTGEVEAMPVETVEGKQFIIPRRVVDVPEEEPVPVD